MFSAWLQSRCLDLGIHGPEELRRLLERYGVQRSASTVAYWWAGERTPERAAMAGLLDALGVVDDERSRALELWVAAPSAA